MKTLLRFLLPCTFRSCSCVSCVCTIEPAGLYSLPDPTLPPAIHQQSTHSLTSFTSLSLALHPSIRICATSKTACSCLCHHSPFILHSRHTQTHTQTHSHRQHTAAHRVEWKADLWNAFAYYNFERTTLNIQRDKGAHISGRVEWKVPTFVEKRSFARLACIFQLYTRYTIVQNIHTRYTCIVQNIM